MKQQVMNSLKKVINEEAKNLPLVRSNFEDFHLQAPLFFKIKDMSEQDKILSQLKNDPAFEKVEKTGKGFLSLKLNLDYFIKPMHEKQVPKTIVIDYCGVNVAKQMHIGHIRSMFIGDYIARAHQFQEDICVLQNHLGDWGSQFGYLLGYLIQYQIKPKSNKDLTEVYKKAYECYQSDGEFKKFADAVSLKLIQKDPEMLELWKKTVDLSLSEAQKFFNLFHLNFSLKDTAGESFYADRVDGIVQELIDQKIAFEESDGSVVVFFNEEGLSPLVLKKQTGVYLYAAYDLAALKYRAETFKPDKIVYVVDKRQSLHFQQVFSIGQKAGWNRGVELQHVGFGTIMGEDKKPIKTRSGKSLYLDDLLEQGQIEFQKSHAYESLKNNDVLWAKIDEKSVIGALKYYDLHLAAPEDYVFDWKHVLNTQGNSAPYLQNAFVRIDSILEKLGVDDWVDFKHNSKGLSQKEFNAGLEKYYPSHVHGFNQEVQELCFETLFLREQIEQQSKDYQSHQLTQQLLAVAKKFHYFYEQHPIKGSVHEKDYANLIAWVGLHLKAGLQILGIEVYPCLNRLKKMDVREVLVDHKKIHRPY